MRRLPSFLQKLAIIDPSNSSFSVYGWAQPVSQSVGMTNYSFSPHFLDPIPGGLVTTNIVPRNIRPELEHSRLGKEADWLAVAGLQPASQSTARSQTEEREREKSKIASAVAAATALATVRVVSRNLVCRHSAEYMTQDMGVYVASLCT